MKEASGIRDHVEATLLPWDKSPCNRKQLEIGPNMIRGERAGRKGVGILRDANLFG